MLDLRVPTVSHSLLDAVLKEWPAYLSYVFSFLIIGIIWGQHHRMFQFIRHTDHLFILMNVIFLTWVAIVPSPTAILARYLENPGERQTAIAIYTGIFAIGGVRVSLKWLYAIHHGRLLGEVESPPQWKVHPSGKSTPAVDRGMIQQLTCGVDFPPAIHWGRSSWRAPSVM